MDLVTKFISKLENTDRDIYKSIAKSISLWTPFLKDNKNKNGVETLLRYTISKAIYVDSDGKEHESIITSSSRIIQLLSLKKTTKLKENIKEIMSLPNKGLTYRKSMWVLTYDIIDMRYVSFKVDNKLKVVPLTTLSEDNAEYIKMLLDYITKK